MSEGSFKTAEVIDLDTLTNSRVVVDNVGDSVVTDPASRPGNGKSVTVLSSSTNTHTPLSATRGLPTSLTPLDLTRPLKTEGEASPSMSTVSHPPPTGGASILTASRPAGTPLSGNSVSQTASGDSPSPSLPASVASISTIGTFGSPLTALGAQLNLTPEEQSAAYRKANILALSALAKKGGPNAREMLAVQAKLQEFLTNLISLAGNSGQQLKSTVQMLVQQLVTGSISEQEFAMRIEKDLHSQHQPSLLPFLQNSVPHLRTRLQLQQAIMKELLQRQAQEKLQKKLQTKQVQTPSISTASGTNNSIHSADISQLAMVDMVGPASGSSSAAGQSLTQQHTKLNNVASNSSPSAPSLSLPSSSAQSPGSVPLPISTTSLTAQIREQLAKLTPQQRQLYMQQLTQAKQIKPLQSQQNLTSTSSPVHAAKASNSVSVSALNSANTVKVTAQPVGVNVQQVSVGTVAVKHISPRIPPTSSAASPNTTANHHLSTNLSPSRGGPVRTGFVDVKLAPGVSKSVSPPSASTGKGKGRVKSETGKNVADDDEEEDDEMDFSGVKTVNLQAESMLPTHLGDTMRTVRDETFFELRPLRQRVLPIAQRFGVCDVSDEFLVLLSHGLQERLKDVLEKVTIVSQHRTESLKDESEYEVTSEVKGQLKVLESIDRMSHKRKEEREKDKILKAARSRSRAEDPEAAAKIKEQAKKLQQEEAQKIRDRRANEAALAALTAISSGTKRKRPSEGVSSSLSSQEAGSGHTSLLGAQTSRQPKRRVTARDLLFYMEQTKETKKSLLLYKSLLK